MKKERRDKHFIHKPEYPGGPSAFKKFVAANLKYPEEARLKGIQGTVRVRYEIDYTGKVVDTKVLVGLGYGCDEEAMRIVKLLKFKVPKHRGMKVGFYRTTNINFKLKKETTSGISYSFSAASKSVGDPKGDTDRGKSGSYHYTITIN